MPGHCVFRLAPVSRVTYDQFGRVYQVFDAAGDGSYTSDGIVNGYNAYGYLESVADAVRYGTEPRVIYRRILGMNARGQVTVEERGIDLQHGTGPAVTTTYDYWPASGRLRSVSGTNPVGFDVQDLDYTWDQLGNLTRRQDYSGSKSLTETFQYDGLNRLTQATVAGQGPVTVTYDIWHLGNIASKSDVGSYAYNSSRPHAVTSAGGATYAYDANGNNLTGDGRTLKYTTFDKPYEITRGGHKTRFAYGPERARYLRVDQGADGITITRYIGNVEIIDRPDGRQERKRYIAGVAIETRTVSGGVESGRTTLYLHHDHLGSLDVITDASGTVVQAFSFDAWGQRRNATNWQALSAGALTGFDHSLTTRGFTGHEMLDEVGLIHMTGRVYDPKLGRFLQADPIVQDPLNSQSLNRYSYAWNNPLNATDPSGYFIFTLAAMIAVAAETISTVQAIVAAFAFAGFGDTLLMGGSFKDALLSGIAAGVSAGAFAKVGGALASKFGGNFAAGLNGIGFSIKVVSHGVIGGITSIIRGGKFGHGFASGFFTAAATSFNNSQFIGGEGFSPTRVMVAATIGGTASEISGGKFANGAITGAFSQALNYEKHQLLAQKLKERQYKLALVAERPNDDSSVGHVFIGGIKPDGSTEAFGFYPESRNLDALYAGEELEGLVKNDTMLFDMALEGDIDFQVMLFTVDESTYRSAMDFIQDYDNHNDYSLFTNSCVHAAFNTIHHVGLNSTSPNVWYTWGLRPSNVYEAIDDAN